MGKVRAVLVAVFAAFISIVMVTSASATSGDPYRPLRQAAERVQAGHGTSGDLRLLKLHPDIAGAVIDPHLTTWTVRTSAAANVGAYAAKAKCKTVDVAQRERTILGFTAYVWHHKVRFCYTSKKVTSWKTRYDYVTQKDGLFYVRELQVNKKGPVNKASSYSHMQRHIENCIPKIGCLQSFTPWSKITVKKKGTTAGRVKADSRDVRCGPMRCVGPPRDTGRDQYTLEMLTWVWVYLGIALAGLVMVACFAVWLWRKAMVLLDEAGVLLQRADQLAGILEQIGQPQDFDASQTSHRFGDENVPGGRTDEVSASRQGAT